MIRPSLFHKEEPNPARSASLSTSTDLVMVKGAYDRAGGPETVLQMIVSHLDRERFRPLLTLLARRDQELPAVLADLTAHVPSRRLSWYGLSGAPFTALSLARLLRERPGAILHTNDMRSDLLGYLVTRIHRVPWIAHVHGWLGETHAGRWKMYEDIDRWLIRGADLVLVGSNAMANETRQAGARWVEVVTNGISAVDPAAFDAEAEAIRTDLVAAGGLVVGMLGRLHPGKGQALLIEALAKLRGQGRELTVLLVGEGPAEAEYRALARNLGVADHVHFAGLVADIHPYLRAMDIVCVPSLKDSLPLTAFEAMSVARPVIASRAGDLPLAIEHGHTGLLVETGSAESLAAAIDRLAADAEFRARIGEAGHAELIARFTPQAMLRQLEGFCDQLLARRVGRGR
jgi:glycosyltransferase involved in cell wall biosynthesis